MQMNHIRMQMKHIQFCPKFCDTEFEAMGIEEND